MKILGRVLWGILLLAGFASAPGLAHRVNIFAWVDGDTVRVDCGFNRSQKVKGGEIEVLDALNGEILLTGRTDGQGAFAFPVLEAAREHGLRVRILAGAGHQNEWLVEADELAAAGPVRTASPQPDPVATATLSQQEEAPEARAALPRTELEEVVEAALDRQLAPIKRMLAEQTTAGPGLREIVGGLGWIVGLAGLAAWVSSRRRGRD